MSTQPAGFTMIGDIVGSRHSADRAETQRTLEDTLSWANARLNPSQSLETTVGDEFQGVFASLEVAVLAALRLRLRLLPLIDIRMGIGHGRFHVFDDVRRPIRQDGPAWWAARRAIERVHARADASRTRSSRTWFSSEDEPALEPWANALLMCSDQILATQNDRTIAILGKLFDGQTQAAIAKAQGISPSAVSQSLDRSGARTLVLAYAELTSSTGGQESWHVPTST